LGEIRRQGQLPAEAYVASPSRAAAFDKNRLESQKGAAELDEKRMTTLAKGVGLLKDRLQTVTDEPTYQSYVQYAHKVLGPDMVSQASLPPNYDPEWVRRTLVKSEDLFTPKPQTVNLGGKEVVIDMNPFTNPKVVGMQLPKTLSPGEQQPVWDEARGVWVSKPGGPTAAAPGAAPVAAPSGAPAAAPAGGPAPAVVRPAGLPPKPTDVHNLRNEFNQLPEVKGYRDIVPVVEAARGAPDTRAGDIQLGYAVGKILDPNSVVREGEIKMVGDAAPIYQKYKGEFDSIANGTGRFTPETRKQLVAMLDNAVNQRETAYNAGGHDLQGYRREERHAGRSGDHHADEAHRTAGQGCAEPEALRQDAGGLAVQGETPSG
jgi:hypothetical protein